MDDIRQTAIDRFRAYLERRQFSGHTIASYTLDLHVFFTTVTVPLAQVSFREVDHFVEHQHPQGRAWATINRRVVYLHPADKYSRLTHRPSQGQKGIDERALMASQ